MVSATLGLQFSHLSYGIIRFLETHQSSINSANSRSSSSVSPDAVGSGSTGSGLTSSFCSAGFGGGGCNSSNIHRQAI